MGKLFWKSCIGLPRATGTESPRLEEPCQSSRLQPWAEDDCGQTENYLTMGGCALIHMIGEFCQLTVMVIRHMNIEVERDFPKRDVVAEGFIALTFGMQALSS